MNFLREIKELKGEMLRAVSTPLPVAGEKIDDCEKVKGLLSVYPYPSYPLF